MMQYTSLSIGDAIPAPEAKRGIMGAPIPPVWYCLTSKVQSEAKAKAWLIEQGLDAESVWYPTQEEHRRWKLSTGKTHVQVVIKALVPRYVFARFTGSPQWDVLRGCRYLAGVVGYRGEPAPITDATLLQMQSVPQRLAEIKAREIEARTIRAGDRVTITDGQLAGWVVDVSEVKHGIARFIVPMLGGGEGSIEVGRVVK